MFHRTDLRSREFRKSATPRRRVPLEVSRLEGRVLMTGNPDTTAPGTAVEYSGVYGGDGYFKSPVTLTFTGKDVDDASNTIRTFVSVNGGPTVERNSVTLNDDGNYNVAYYSVDPAGNGQYTQHQFVHIDRTPPVILAYAHPTILWPPNHKYVPVTVTGLVGDWTSGAAHRVTYQVYDEYHQVQPSGSANVDVYGRYRFVVYLQASRLGQDHDGRLYRIAVTAYDNAGNTATVAPGVLVPHDMGHSYPVAPGYPGNPPPPPPHRSPKPRHPQPPVPLPRPVAHPGPGHPGNPGHPKQHAPVPPHFVNPGHGHPGNPGKGHGNGPGKKK